MNTTTILTIAHAGHGAGAHPFDHGLAFVLVFAVALALAFALRGNR